MTVGCCTSWMLEWVGQYRAVVFLLLSEFWWYYYQRRSVLLDNLAVVALPSALAGFSWQFQLDPWCPLVTIQNCRLKSSL